MKVGLVCSHGGHLTEVLQIVDAFEGHDVFIATYRSSRNTQVSRLARAYFTENIGWSLPRMLKAIVWAVSVLRVERPRVIISFGAEIALPFFFWAKLLGIETLYIESWCRVKTLSLTGRILLPAADSFWVQWPELAQEVGPKVQYQGAVL